jgi:hypothetical protein
VTAVRGSRGYEVIDTDYGPKVDEIRRATADCLEQSPTWLTILSGSSNTPMQFDFAAYGATVIAHANCRTRILQDQYVPSLESRFQRRRGPHGRPGF